MTATRLIAATDKLTATCEQLTFGAPITHTYHPLRYARRAHNKYLRQFGDGTKRTLFWGMNPGPWGMTQTGVPFGEVAAVRDWMKICEAPQQQPDTHPARPILGFDCPRSEVSGRRLWDLFAQEYKTAAAFFSDHLVLNYCPLLFLSAEGKRCTNITPDKLSPAEKTPLFEACDIFLRRVVDILQPQYLIGVGGFAETRLLTLFSDSDITIGKILHPSPANPAANRGFATTATAQLQTLGVWQTPTQY